MLWWRGSQKVTYIEGNVLSKRLLQITLDTSAQYKQFDSLLAVRTTERQVHRAAQRVKLSILLRRGDQHWLRIQVHTPVVAAMEGSP